MSEILHNIGRFLSYDPSAPMLFSSGTFWALFLVFMPLYGLLRRRLWQMVVFVVAFSFFFYYKSSGLFFFLLLFVATSDYCIAQCMAKTASRWGRKAWVILSLCVDLGLLGYFKYFNFLRESVVSVAHELGYQIGNTSLQSLTYQPLDIFLPVGISFFTFQAMSYVIDVYTGKVKCQKNPLLVFLYVSFFPQLVAGPIVKYSDVEQQLLQRKETVDKFVCGIKRFLYGLAKK